ncbi:hypothetical protein OQA88_5213 [Cercophora sp. LCS_1]
MSASTSRAGGPSSTPLQGRFFEPGTFDINREYEFAKGVEEMCEEGERLRTGQDQWADVLYEEEEARRQRENAPLEQAINNVVNQLFPKGMIEEMALHTQAADAYSHRPRRAMTVRDLEGTLDFDPREKPVFPSFVPKMPWKFGDGCTSPDDRICDACAAIRLERQLCIPRIYASSFGFPLADAKASKGCPLCRLLVASFNDQSLVDDPPWGDDTMILARVDSFAGLTSTTTRDGLRAVQELGGSHRIYTDLISRDAFGGQESLTSMYSKITYRTGIQLMESPVPNTLTNRDFGRARAIGPSRVFPRLLKSWDRRCQNEHLDSCSNEEPFGLPRHRGFRLIDVTNRCLVEGAILEECRYAALSYVWGKAKQLLNTTVTRWRLNTPGGLADDWPDVPQTIKDAMLLCEKLGIYFLWIDALCIQQDDEVDKGIQIENMADIYSRSGLTIVAACCSDASCGLRGLRRGSRQPNQRIEIAGGVRLTTIQPQFATIMAACKWDTRGWTLQENLLSRRQLIVTETQWFWRCRGAIWYEDAQLEVQRDVNVILNDDKDKAFHYDASKDATTRYKELANSFVSRQLTDEADCEMSVTGILKTLQPQLGRMFGGIPERYFDAVILWDWGHGDPGAVAARVKLFPSWSWLSRALSPGCNAGGATCWDAILSEKHYLDSQTRLCLAPRAVVSMVTYYRFASDGVPVKLESDVFPSTRDPLYRKYLEDRKVPVEWPPVPRVTMYESEADLAARQKAVKPKGLKRLFSSKTSKVINRASELGICIPKSMDVLLDRAVAFFAECATLELRPAAGGDPNIFDAHLPGDDKHLASVRVPESWTPGSPRWVECVVVARHSSFGPHLVGMGPFKKKLGWYYHALIVQQVFGAVNTFPLATKVGVALDLDAEVWEKAARKWKVVLLI